MTEHSHRRLAVEPEDLDLARANAGDVDAVVARYEPSAPTVEVARRQADGTWLWIIDQPAVLE
jgi:hypothetical protein